LPASGVQRLAIGLEYDGTAFAGWQRQQTVQRPVRTVQEVAEDALGRIASEPISLTCAGRTDAGVHARGQVAHFDTHAARSLRGWVLGANTELPRDVSVSWACPVPPEFHARYSALARTYRYFILNTSARSALAEKRAAWFARPLDHERMRAACPILTGEHDFSAFRAAECQAKSPIRHLKDLLVERQGDWVVIEATANAFLHHMVRNLAGLLIAIGQGEHEPSWAKEVLDNRDRRRNAATAPASGLYFWSVRYASTFSLPDTAGPTVSRSAMIPGRPAVDSPSSAGGQA
jgi:tRNA pseudouridine38-40 synthase